MLGGFLMWGLTPAYLSIRNSPLSITMTHPYPSLSAAADKKRGIYLVPPL